MNTVFPANDPLYFINAWKAVIAANGTAAASLKERFLGLGAMKNSGHLQYSLRDPGVSLISPFA